MSLAEKLPGLILGGAVFNTQMNDDPYKLPVVDILAKAFDMGINAIDTSPYYGPSEELIGQALAHPDISGKYKREDYILMTKCGRIALNDFDYSPEWIRQSVERSLKRLNTTYLDCVYLHDIEFVTTEDVLKALPVLFEFKSRGIIKTVGISGYPLDVLTKALESIKTQLPEFVDVVQNYAQFTLQNRNLDRYLDKWTGLGVQCIIASSPLNMGLLSGKPAPAFHPASQSLRDACMDAAAFCVKNGTTLPDLALRYVIGHWNKEARRNGGGFLISGVSFVDELEHVASVYGDLLLRPPNTPDHIKVGNRWLLDEAKLDQYEPEFRQVQAVFGQHYGESI